LPVLPLLKETKTRTVNPWAGPAAVLRQAEAASGNKRASLT
jgi:hypothetical protein